MQIEALFIPRTLQILWFLSFPLHGMSTSRAPGTVSDENSLPLSSKLWMVF
jgi:hypothetical protein